MVQKKRCDLLLGANYKAPRNTPENSVQEVNTDEPKICGIDAPDGVDMSRKYS